MVLPRTANEVRAILRLCHRLRVPVVARGAGTGLSGGALPHAEGVLLSPTRLSGGVHCLKYGLTLNNLLALTVMTIEGERLEPAARHWMRRAMICSRS